MEAMTRAVQRIGPLALGITALGLVTGVGSAPAQQATGAVALASFTTPGTYLWKVPAGVSEVSFDVFGARGGGVLAILPGGSVQVVSNGGSGGEAQGSFAVHKGEKFQVNVGGQGGTATEYSTTGAGGFNGGGGGAQYSGEASGGGGGASDVRIGGRQDPCVGNQLSCQVDDRIIVAGGGGGGTDHLIGGISGGAGGGLVGTNLQAPGDVATQETSGSCSGISDGAGFGYGQDGYGPYPSGSGYLGGGGGGWWGGCADGGGSGYVSPLALAGSLPGGTSQGDGSVLITTSSVPAGSRPSAATATTFATFTAPGAHIWTVPAGITAATFNVWGASGGAVAAILPDHSVEVISSGGAGGHTKSRVAVQPGEQIQVTVGGQGGTATEYTIPGAAGVNGGGVGDDNDDESDSGTVSGGGGGGSDVRIGGTGNSCAATASCGYTDRIIAAGGGGGGADDTVGGINGNMNGGNGGGLTGFDLFYPNDTTGQEPGVCGTYNGGAGFGFGADGWNGVGAGGGGWWGGCLNGGASGHVNSLTLSGSFPPGTRTGDGMVKITS